ncbi:MAG: glycosyl hydrolase 53 family protein, partial [Muribaculaceae bacterium]|nr:glycosyl hydrolase 53 family protein [Roseburia sp.]MCM1493468.1 glycosyl hydrolase 53 family protein [Muribaculaceae bacterium]
MKQRWVKRVTSLVLALAMVIAGLGPWSGGLMAVKAEETELFTNTSADDWTVNVQTVTKSYANDALTLTNDGEGSDVIVSQDIELEDGVTPTCTVTATSSDSGVWINAYDNEKWSSNSVEATAAGAELSWTAYNSGDIGWSIWMPANTSVTLSGMSLKVVTDEGNQDDEGEDGYSIVYYKEDYSTASATGWHSVWADATVSPKDEVGENCWKTWSESENTATFTKNFDNLPAGDYTMSLVAVGGTMGSCSIALTDGTNSANKDLTINAWGNSVKTTTDALTLAAAGTITATITCAYNAGGWLDFDDIILSKKVSLAEKLAYEKEQLQTIVTACADYEESVYTADSWTALQTALTDANTVLGKADAELAEITSALEALEAAVKGLKEGGIFVKQVENLSENFICGADISSYVSVKDSGAIFKDSEGNVLSDAEFFTLLKDSGINYVRIKIWNDPYTADSKGYGGGNSDLAKAKTIGKLATDAGMGVLIDFHYSDFWADPERQYAPKAWKDYTVAQKEEALYNFTKESLEALEDYGVDVGMVQVGNETNNGIAGVSGWEDMCKLFSAGSRAVRDVDENILVAVHFTDPQTIGHFDNVTAQLDTYGVDYDVFATSYYPNIHGSMENLTSVLVKIAQTYNKKVMVAETSWAWTTADGDGHSQSFDPGTNADYNISVQGQATLIRDVVEAVNNVNKTVPNSSIGVFYWEPTWIPVEYAYDEGGKRIETIYESNQEKWEEFGSGWASSYSNEYDPEHGGAYYGGSVKDNEAFFDFEGNPLDSLTVFKDLRTGRTGPVVKLEVVKDGSVEILLDTSDVTTKLAEIKAGLPENVIAIFNDGERVPFAATWNVEEVDTKVTDFGTYRITGTASGSYKEQNYEGEAECEILVLPNSILTNGDFESGSTGWTVANADGVEIKWNDTPVRGSGAMHFYSGSDMNFTMSQTVTVANAGMYCATMQLQGGDGSDADDINISITNLTSGASVKKNAQLRGWAVWQKPVTEGISAAAGDRVTVTITVKSVAGAWGSVDDVFLYRIGDAVNSGTTGSTTTSSSSTTSTTPVTTTEVKPDGTTVVTTTTTNTDGSKTETVTATATDGSKTETKT